jgi:hypothetical protein
MRGSVTGLVFGQPGRANGKHPSRTDPADGKLRITTDSHSVYRTVLKEWMGFEDTKTTPEGNTRRWAWLPERAFADGSKKCATYRHDE